MPGNAFSVTPTPPTVLSLRPGVEGTFSFTVTSLAAPNKVHEVALQALLVDKEGKRGEGTGGGGGATFAFTLPRLAAPNKAHEVALQALLVDKEGKREEASWLVAEPQRSTR